MERKRGSARLVLGLLGLLALVLAIVLLALGGYGAPRVLRGPQPLEGLSVNGLKGRYVRARVELVVDEYAQVESTNLLGGAVEVTGREYAIYLPDGEHVMGLLLEGEALESQGPGLAALIEEGPSAPAVELSGTVLPMPADSAQYFSQALAFHNISEGLALPHLLVAGQVAGKPVGQVLALFWAAVALAVLGAGLLVAAATRRK